MGDAAKDRKSFQHLSCAQDTFSITDTELVYLWETTTTLHPLDRALTLLSVVLKESPDNLLQASLGTRNAWLFSLRKNTFGDEMTSIVNCPECRQEMELELEASRMLSVGQSAKDGPFLMEHAGYRIQFRLPTSADLIHLTKQGHTRNIGTRLIQACILSAEKMQEDGTTLSVLPTQLSSKLLHAIAALIQEYDPLAEILISMECISCHFTWKAVLDIADYLVKEITIYAKRLLSEVHSLAAHYGWREQDILLMSRKRRQFYLSLLNGEKTL